MICMSNNVNSDFYEVEIKCLNKVIAHMSCSAVKDTLNVRDLWVRKLFRNKGVEELLMEKLFDFAKDKKVKNIVTYCGSEPFCPDGQVSMDEEVNFFEDHGFKLDHHVFGLVPCMIKTM